MRSAPPTLAALAPPLRLGDHVAWPPVVLAPMAGVTNRPFRELCRSFAAAAKADVDAPDADAKADFEAEAEAGGPNTGDVPGLFVSEMVSARALCFDNATTWDRYAAFGPAEQPRSLQLYATDPADAAEAVRRLLDAGRVDHLDLNFGCPATKVTRKGGGSAIPLKPRLLAAIVGAAVRAAGGRVPVTMKFRIGLDDELITYLDAGRVGEAEGCAAVALHARTAVQLYDGEADWSCIARLKQAVSIPVLGNGDLFEASDALAMMAKTGCDGVVIGRGCLGRPWLFADLVRAFAGQEPTAAPCLGEVAAVMAAHARALVDWTGETRALRDFRKHAAWYLKGYPVPPSLRSGLGGLATLADLAQLTSQLDPTATVSPAAARQPRAKRRRSSGRIALPDGYLDNRDDDKPPDNAAAVDHQGGG